MTPMTTVAIPSSIKIQAQPLMNSQRRFAVWKEIDSLLPTDAVHLRNRGSEQTTERPGNGGGGEEDGSTDTELGTFVPAGQVIVDAREQTCFRQTQKPSLLDTSVCR